MIIILEHIVQSFPAQCGVFVVDGYDIVSHRVEDRIRENNRRMGHRYYLDSSIVDKLRKISSVQVDVCSDVEVLVKLVKQQRAWLLVREIAELRIEPALGFVSVRPDVVGSSGII